MKARTATLTALEANALDSEQSNQAEISYHAAAGDTAWVELIERLRKAPDLVVQQRKDQAAAAAAALAAVQNAKRPHTVVDGLADTGAVLGRAG